MYHKLSSIVVALVTSSALAFSFVPTTHNGVRRATSTRTFMSDTSDEFPSDSSTEEIVDVESEEVEPTVSGGILNSILDEIPDEGKPVTSVSKETRASINEAILKLETLNPTENPTSSPLMNGVWSLRYSGGYDEEWALPSPTRQIALFLYSGGYSPGLFALSLASTLPSGLVEVGELDISISREQPRIEAKVDVKFLGGATNDVVVKSRLEVASDVRFTETYESATVLGRAFDIPEAIQYSRELYVVYLDDDMMVVRDGSGVPEILIRKQ